MTFQIIYLQIDFKRLVLKLNGLGEPRKYTKTEASLTVSYMKVSYVMFLKSICT